MPPRRHAPLAIIPSPHPRDAMDTAGACVAVLCGVHCALAPLVLVVAPVLAGGWLASERAELALLILGLLLGVASIVPGALRRHRRRLPLVLLVAAIGVVLVARLALDEASPVGTTTMVAGTALLALAHLVNRRALARATPTAATST